jgi:hypothetical protein
MSIQGNVLVNEQFEQLRWLQNCCKRAGTGSSLRLSNTPHLLLCSFHLLLDRTSTHLDMSNFSPSDILLFKTIAIGKVS